MNGISNWNIIIKLYNLLVFSYSKNIYRVMIKERKQISNSWSTHKNEIKIWLKAQYLFKRNMQEKNKIVF